MNKCWSHDVASEIRNGLISITRQRRCCLSQLANIPVSSKLVDDRIALQYTCFILKYVLSLGELLEQNSRR
jgi:hypothetical protein